MKKIPLLVIPITLLLLTGCSSTYNFTKPQQSSKKARVIIDVPASVSIDTVKAALRDAIAYRSESFKENEDFLPAKLPDEAGHPVKNNAFGSLAAMGAGNPNMESMTYDTSKAYYFIKGKEDMSTPFHTKEMAYVGALYPAKTYSRIYLVIFYEEGSEGIGGAITKATNDILVGEEGAIPFIVQIKEKFLSLVPEAEIVSTSPSEIKKLKLDIFNTVASEPKR